MKPAVLLLLVLFLLPNFATADLFSPQTASAISSQTQIPVEWLASWWKIVLYIILPLWALGFVIYEFIKEINIFQKNAVNVVLAIMLVGFLIPQGFFGYVVKITAKTEAMMFIGVGILSFLVVLKIRRSIANVGYSGVLSGVLVYILDAAGVGILFAVIGYLLGGMTLGSHAYAGFIFGAALGVFLVFWEKRKKTSLGEVKTLLNKEENVVKTIGELKKEAEKYRKLIDTTNEKDPKRMGYIREFTAVMQLIKQKEAEEEYLEMREEDVTSA